MSSTNTLKCFKAYDVRGKLGIEINEDIAYRIGRATAQALQAKSLVVGFDVRQSSPILAQALVKGICDARSDVLDIGLVGTEQMYSAVSEFNACAGIEVTASHNPINYNGMKIVKRGSQPLSSEEFSIIRSLTEENNFHISEKIGSVINKKNEAFAAYLAKIISFIEIKNLKPLKIVINSGNGAAGSVLDSLNEELSAKDVETDFIFVHHDADPTFPNGIPNPLLVENRASTANAVKQEQADFGVAFDGDFDRCFLFDHFGNFVPGEYVVGLLAKIFLKKEKGGTIVHDSRVIWNTKEMIRTFGGHSVISKTGHSVVKRNMRKFGAVYGGEISAHHYFRDFNYCDSGMIPWLLVWELLSKENILLADLISERKQLFPSSGEINFKVNDAIGLIAKLKDFYFGKATSVEELDGLSMVFESWRFNLRRSQTEELVRLNVEVLGNEALLKSKTNELIEFISDV